MHKLHLNTNMVASFPLYIRSIQAKSLIKALNITQLMHLLIYVSCAILGFVQRALFRHGVSDNTLIYPLQDFDGCTPEQRLYFPQTSFQLHTIVDSLIT